MKVRERKGHLSAQDKAGATVLEGGREGTGDFVATSANGRWRIGSQVSDARGKHVPVFDAANREVATLRSPGRGEHAIELPTGESFLASGSKWSTKGFALTIGELASAKAPFFAPQRYFTLTLTDRLLSRPDRELLAAICMWMAESHISMAIINRTD